MNISDIKFIFNRAWSKTFNRKKLLLMFTVLLLCGLLVVFFHGLSSGVGSWMRKSLIFMPFFLCAGVMLSTGIMLIRIYHDEVKEKQVSYRQVFSKSWEIVIGSSYFSIPIILCYLFLWTFLGVFIFFEQAPYVGPFFSVILAFGPFLLNLAALILCISNVAMLFFVAPTIALKGLNGQKISQSLTSKFNNDVFSCVLLGLIAILPIVIVTLILMLAGFMSGPAHIPTQIPLFSTLRWFILMIPFVAALSPTLIFFFNFSAEAHVLLMKEVKKKS